MVLEDIGMKRDFSDSKRVVIKVGTNLLSTNDGVDMQFMEKIVHEIQMLRNMGYKPLLVSSGAIGMGAKELGISQPAKNIIKRQAYASIGQPLLMHKYRLLFSSYGIIVSQILLTRNVLNNRKSFLNLKNSVEDLLAMGVVPIFNENDSISTDEIGTAFGDNDSLSALIASKIDADLLIILTDIDGLYTGNPKKDPKAQLMHYIEKVDEHIISWASGAGSSFATGGMRTKLTAVQIASQAGCGSVIAKGTEPNILKRILEGEDIGTYFQYAQRKSQRERWILQSTTTGRILVDDGALEALKRHKSLLPSGIKGVEGVFDRDTVVMINDCAKVVPSFNSSEIENLIGMHSSDIRDKIGNGRRDVIARPEDIVFLED
mgnify:CR=1 FL=1